MNAGQNIDFKEVGHCGGKITFIFRKDGNGQLLSSIKWASQRPNPAALAGVYALDNGLAVCPLFFAGLGQPWSPPPFQGCVPVIIGSDSEGHFGHKCSNCDRYWRSNPYPNFCPYCGVALQISSCLSDAQKTYVGHYVKTLNDATESALSGLAPNEQKEVEIDLDSVADAVASPEKPDFYLSEESQQKKFHCYRCGHFNDVLGRYAYCSTCGVRNDSQIAGEEIEEIRNSINNGGSLSTALRSGVALFDSFIRQFVEQILHLVPMTPRRRNQLGKQAFHDLKFVRESFQDCLDITLCRDMSATDITYAEKMFHRRHLHEHKGSIVDQKYINDSGDTNVRIGQELRETREDVHRFLSILSRMFNNAHEQFNSIIPPADIDKP